MKKFLSYILISLVIGANLLAPISIGWNKNNLEVKSNKAEANDSIKVTTTGTALDTTISGTVHLVLGNNGWRTDESQVIVFILDKSVPQKVIYTYPIVFHDVPKDPTESYADSVQEGTFSVPDLTPSTDYEIRTVASQNIISWWGVVKQTLGVVDGVDFATIESLAGPVDTIARVALGVAVLTPNGDLNNTTMADPLNLTTNKKGDTTTISTGQSTAVNEDAILPTCSWASSSTWGGCVGRLFYWAIFKPTSYIFGLTGKLLDLSVDYSIKDTSYRSSFVVEGWGVVRDFCNMFFIFVLLYIAFKTILGLGASKTKEMVINVVIIGLLINFSLFATQVIIDASNILTRVFYNSQSIAIGPKINGVIQDQRGSNGEIKLSEALVAKINPQKLILQASKADNIQTKQTIPDSLKQTNGISATTFILVTILASVVNIVGLITFLMCSLIFISRVIGLWMAMIFAPLAFFSYTIPALQDTEMIGWKKWWPETLKMAFLAPVFIFFMYLIIKFLDTGLGLVINDSASGMDFILGIFIPFIFIMILLTKAKDVAKKMSGTIGEKITNAAKTVGGVALGAGLGAGAMAMRGTVGRLAENMSEKQGFKDWAAKSRFGGSMLKATRGVASGSFDARGVKVFGKDLSSTGLKVGKSGGVGGFTKGRKDWTENQEKFASSLNMNEKERYDRGLTFTGAPGEDRTAIQAQIDAINTERRLNRAETVDGATTSRNIASTKIREASINRNKKLQDALIAAAGGGTPATPPTPPTPPHP